MFTDVYSFLFIYLFIDKVSQKKQKDLKENS